MQKIAITTGLALGLLLTYGLGTASASEDVFTNSIGMKFVKVPAGSFMMGSKEPACPDDDSSCTSGVSKDEQPIHMVIISQDFYIGRYEVTQAQWQAVMGTNPSRFKSGPDYPVEQVSWDDAQDFIKKLNAKEGRNYRLPTEAEWEYACRSGGKDQKYCGGDDVDALAWYKGNSGKQTHQVGTKRANGLGIYDMSGNVWEWCSDRYDQDYYGHSPTDDPLGASVGEDRVDRGGSWSGVEGYARAANRLNRNSGYRLGPVGFRLVAP